jgi:UDPglucose 6-dehydrogenase
MSLISAELTKLATNAMIAQQISSINAIGAICESVGADVGALEKAFRQNRRIGPQYFKAGMGFGGSCLEKDTTELVSMSRSLGLTEVSDYWLGVININRFQKERMKAKVSNWFGGSFQGRKIALLGLAYKKGTKDVRSSIAIWMLRQILLGGAFVAVFDPSIEEWEVRNEIGIVKWTGQLVFCESAYKACEGVDAILLMTDEQQFANIDWSNFAKGMKEPRFVLDGRDALDDKLMASLGFIVEKAGR